MRKSTFQVKNNHLLFMRKNQQHEFPFFKKTMYLKNEHLITSTYIEKIS